MPNRIVLEVSFPYWTAYRANVELLLRSPGRLFAAMIFPIAGVYLIYLWNTHHHAYQPTDYLLLAACFLFVPLILAMSLFIVRRKNPLTKGPFTYTFDRDGLHVSGTAFSLSIQWSAVQKIRESKTFMFFFISPRQAHCIPIDQLTAAGQIESLRTFARTMVNT